MRRRRQADRGASLYACGAPALVMGCLPDFARGVGVHDGDADADDEVGPGRSPQDGGDHAGRDDRDVGEHVVARRQKGRLGETAADDARKRARIKAQVRLTTRAPIPVSVSGKGAGGTGDASFCHAVQSPASAGARRMTASTMPSMSASPRAPADRNRDQDIDRGIFEKIDAVGKQRDRADRKRDRELDAEIGEIQSGDHQHRAAQSRACLALAQSHPHPAPPAARLPRHPRPCWR